MTDNLLKWLKPPEGVDPDKWTDAIRATGNMIVNLMPVATGTQVQSAVSALADAAEAMERERDRAIQRAAMLQSRTTASEEAQGRLCRERNEAMEEVDRMRKVLAGWQCVHGRVPEGAKQLEAWWHGGEIIVIGDPRTLEPPEAEGDPDHPGAHNCDAMGCSSVCHVVARWRPGTSAIQGAGNPIAWAVEMPRGHEFTRKVFANRHEADSESVQLEQDAKDESERFPVIPLYAASDTNPPGTPVPEWVDAAVNKGTGTVSKVPRIDDRLTEDNYPLPVMSPDGTTRYAWRPVSARTRE